MSFSYELIIGVSDGETPLQAAASAASTLSQWRPTINIHGAETIHDGRVRLIAHAPYPIEFETAAEQVETLEILEELGYVTSGSAPSRDPGRLEDLDHVVTAVEAAHVAQDYAYDPEADAIVRGTNYSDQLVEHLLQEATYECSCGESLPDWEWAEFHMRNPNAEYPEFEADPTSTNA